MPAAGEGEGGGGDDAFERDANAGGHAEGFLHAGVEVGQVLGLFPGHGRHGGQGRGSIQLAL